MEVLMMTCLVTAITFRQKYTSTISLKMLPDAVVTGHCPHGEQKHPWRARQAKWMGNLRRITREMLVDFQQPVPTRSHPPCGRSDSSCGIKFFDSPCFCALRRF